MEILTILNAYLEKQKTFAYAIEEHPLGRCEVNIKKIYIQLLKLVLSDSKAVNEKQLDFLERLIKGIDLDDEIKLEITLEEADKKFIEVLGECFFKYFKGSILKYNFILDTILILMQASKEQKAFIRLICETLGLQEGEVRFLMNLATCILEEDSMSYMQIIERVPKGIKMQNFVGYVKPFLIGRLIDNDELVMYYGNERKNLYEKPSFNEIFKSEEMSLERWVFKQDVLVFENWAIDLTHKKWQFRNNQKVIFRGCEIIGDDTPICFDGVSEIIIEDCTFTYFNNRVFLINDCLSFNIKESLFKECVYLYDVYQNSNGCIYFIADKGTTLASGEREIRVEDSKFIDCSVWNKEGHYYSDYSLGYSMSIPQKIIGCDFKNCLSYMGMPKRLCNGGSVLFNQVEAERCNLAASHPIN